MKQENNSTTRGGVGILGLLGVAFVVLKLCHYIDWSWWWVTVPFWGPVVIIIVALIVALIVATILDAREKHG